MSDINSAFPMLSATPVRWIAVTGASGFLGKHVSAALRQRGIGVIALGRRRPPNCSLVEWESLDLADVRNHRFAWMPRASALVHLAWAGLPNYKSRHHQEEEAPRQKAFIDEVLARGLRRLVIAGTCMEYGAQEGELDESSDAHPETPYALAKRAVYLHVHEACQRSACSLSWLRLFYMFGDGQAPTSIWSQINAAVRRGETSFPMSGGQQVRDFMPVDVVADVIAKITLLDQTPEILNVCSGEPRTLESVVRGWIRQHGWLISPDLGRYPYPDYEPFSFWGSRRQLDAVLERANLI